MRKAEVVLGRMEERGGALYHARPSGFLTHYAKSQGLSALHVVIGLVEDLPEQDISEQPWILITLFFMQKN